MNSKKRKEEAVMLMQGGMRYSAQDEKNFYSLGQYNEE